MKGLQFAVSTSPLFTQIAWHQEKQMLSPLESFIDLTRKILLSN